MLFTVYGMYLETVVLISVYLFCFVLCCVFICICLCIVFFWQVSCPTVCTTEFVDLRNDMICMYVCSMMIAYQKVLESKNGNRTNRLVKLSRYWLPHAPFNGMILLHRTLLDRKGTAPSQQRIIVVPWASYLCTTLPMKNLSTVCRIGGYQYDLTGKGNLRVLLLVCPHITFSFVLVCIILIQL
jgi:hypothetical protein